MEGTMKKIITFIIFQIIVFGSSVHFIEKMEHTGIQQVRIADRIEQKNPQLECLAKNIFYESGSESYEGKLAVATVTMNRVAHRSFPRTVCAVVYQRGKRGCQFSWTCGGKSHFNIQLYNESFKVAQQVLLKHKRLYTIKNSVYFHNTSIHPNWDFAVPIKQIGNHIFYTMK